MKRGLAIVLVLCGIWGCSKDRPKSLFDPDYVSQEKPTIHSVTPSGEALAAVVPITIEGAHFLNDTAKVSVWFNTVKAKILQASSDRIVVQSPNLVADSVAIKIAVREADRLSDPYSYRLLQSVFVVGGFNKYDDPYALTCDRHGTVYVSNAPSRLEKVTPEGERTQFGSSIGSGIRMTSVKNMKVGPGDYLYLVSNTNYIARISVDGGDITKWATLSASVYDLDFLPSGSLYTGGRNAPLILVKNDASSSNVADYKGYNIQAIRVFDGYVYIAAEITADRTVHIWRHRINADESVGERELVFNWTENFGTASLLGLTFAADGTMYIGTDLMESIMVLHSDGNFEPLYPGVLLPETYSLCWGPDEFLYIARRNDSKNSSQELQTVLKINMVKLGAPYYGRQ
ncbi:IPT/TIG domain-containing protein [candidate division KSB1 bacterium]|nr:IPT/TIG domain-containing protein [candidate division KSB1 bacterium]